MQFWNWIKSWFEAPPVSEYDPMVLKALAFASLKLANDKSKHVMTDEQRQAEIIQWAGHYLRNK